VLDDSEEFPKCIWRVSTENHRQYEHWLTVESIGDVEKMSMTSQHLLVITRPNGLYQYSRANRKLLGVVQVPEFVTWIYHAIETAYETFVIGHDYSSTEQCEHAWAVSKRSSLSCSYSKCKHFKFIPSHVNGVNSASAVF